MLDGRSSSAFQKAISWPGSPPPSASMSTHKWLPPPFDRNGTQPRRHVDGSSKSEPIMSSSISLVSAMSSSALSMRLSCRLSKLLFGWPLRQR